MFTPFLSEISNIVGAQNVITDARDVAPYCTDWRERYFGQAIAVVRPGATDEVAAVVKACIKHQVSIVPQGGNTGMCGGATPDKSGKQIVLSLQRMNQVRQVDPHNATMTLEAGCILQHAQDVAAQANRLFPLSLGSEGSCTIGGNLSTNAGGTAVLRYGNMRELCLGLEVVTADGQIWNGLRTLRKDNTGYDLRDLFIGAEGTLGIITAAVLKLFPMPIVKWTALISVQSFKSAVDLLSLFQERSSSLLTGFEVMSKPSVDLLTQYFPELNNPLTPTAPFTALVEISDFESEAHAQALMESILGEALEKELAIDAVIASNLSQTKHFWAMREHITLAQAKDGANVKHDITIPISSIDTFVNETNQLLEQYHPNIRMINFGHLGDGNLHYNVAAPQGTDPSAFMKNHAEQIQTIVYAQVDKFNGSMSAEHGVGQVKTDRMLEHRGEIALNLMSQIKKSLDPNNIMNPGKVLPN